MMTPSMTVTVSSMTRRKGMMTKKMCEEAHVARTLGMVGNVGWLGRFVSVCRCLSHPPDAPSTQSVSPSMSERRSVR